MAHGILIVSHLLVLFLCALASLCCFFSKYGEVVDVVQKQISSSPGVGIITFQSSRRASKLVEASPIDFDQSNKLYIISTANPMSHHKLPRSASPAASHVHDTESPSYDGHYRTWQPSNILSNGGSPFVDEEKARVVHNRQHQYQPSLPPHRVDMSEPELVSRPIASVHTPQRSQATRIFVGGVQADMTTDDLAAHFSQFGRVVDVSIRRGRGIAGSKAICFAFVTFTTIDEANYAMQQPQQQIRQHTIAVRPAFQKARENTQLPLHHKRQRHEKEEEDGEYRADGEVKHRYVNNDGNDWKNRHT